MPVNHIRLHNIFWKYWKYWIFFIFVNKMASDVKLFFSCWHESWQKHVFFNITPSLSILRKAHFSILSWHRVTQQISKNRLWVERVARIELAQPGRKHGILPLNYTRMYIYLLYLNSLFFSTFITKFLHIYVNNAIILFMKLAIRLFLGNLGISLANNY